MRPLKVVVADQEMLAVVEALISYRFRSLGIDRIAFDRALDATIDSAGKDSGCYLRGAALLPPPRKTHQHGLVMLDADWGGSPGRQAIENKVRRDLDETGWRTDGEVVVIDPMLEVWAFIDSPHFPVAIRWPNQVEIRQWLESRQEWPPGQAKPSNPKINLNLCARQGSVRIHPKWFFDFTRGSVGLGGCSDPSFIKFRSTLQRWFPEQDPKEHARETDSRVDADDLDSGD